MKKVTFLLVLLFAFSAGIIAQDYIYLRDRQERIAVKNIGISDAGINYEKYADNDGQVYLIKSNQVIIIAYENGEVRLVQDKKKIINAYDFKRNLITYHLIDLTVSNFTISYERILKSGKIGFQIPLSFGYSENGSGFDQNTMSNKFYTGLYLNFYPTGQGIIRYVMGPGIRVGMGSDNDYYYDEYGTHVENQTDSFYGKILINNGAVFTPIPSLSISAILSLGIRYFPDTYYSNDVVKTVAAFSLNLSYRL